MYLKCPHTFTCKVMSGSTHGNLTARAGLDKSLRDDHLKASIDMEMISSHDSPHEDLEEGGIESRKDNDPLLSRSDANPKNEDTTSSRQVIFWLCFWMAKYVSLYSCHILL